MGNIIKKSEIITTIDEKGNETTSIKETTTNFNRNEEPDYIKLYTKMWCEFNEIPLSARNLFLELITRMSYCNTANLKNSQIVYTGKPWSTAIQEKLGWKDRMYQKELKKLCDCNAIKKVTRGVYQINPSYAGKGEWKYNPKLERGGIEDLIAQFNFKDGTIDTKIIWADDGQENEINEMYRQGMNVKREENTILKTVEKRNNNVDNDIDNMLIDIDEAEDLHLFDL